MTRPSLTFDRCPHVLPRVGLAHGLQCLGSRLVAHDHFDAFGYVQPHTTDLAELDLEIWCAEQDFAVRMTGIDPDDACPAIVPFEPGRMVRA